MQCEAIAAMWFSSFFEKALVSRHRGKHVLRPWRSDFSSALLKPKLLPNLLTNFGRLARG